MSSTGIQAPQMPQLAQRAEIQCIYPECGEKFIAEIPPPRIMNTIDVTTISFPHQRLNRCPKCQSMYVFQVIGFEPSGMMLFRFAMLQKQNSIQPGTQSSLAEAIKTNDLASKLKQ